MWNLEQYGLNTALIDERGNRISYRELSTEASSFSEELFQPPYGAEARPLVFIFCENSIGCVLSYVGCIESGAVPLLLDSKMDRALIGRLFDAYSPGFVCLPFEADHTFLDEGWEEKGTRRGYRLMARREQRPLTMNPELAMLLSTSGSTGSPKLVRISRENLKHNTDSIVEYLKLDDSQRPITTLPLQYTYGLSVINTHLMVGAAILLTDQSLMSREFWRFFRNEGATSLAGVPYTYQQLMHMGMHEWDLPSLNVMTQAGGRLGRELHETFGRYAKEKGIRFFVMYGQTEATARMAYLPPEKSLEKLDSIGIAIPGGKFHLENEQGERVQEVNVAGELVYTGANVTLGYAENQEDLAKEDERQGLLHTQDLAMVDEEGYYHIVGRKKRFLKIFGKRYNLDDMEMLLQKSTGNQNCRCAGEDDELYVYLTDGTFRYQAETCLKETFGLSRNLFSCFVVESIPLLANQKTDYGKLTEMAKKTGMCEAKDPGTRESIRNYWQELLSLDGIGPDDDFFSLGGDSVGLSEMMFWLEETFEVQVPYDQFLKEPTISVLAEIVDEKGAWDQSFTRQTVPIKETGGKPPLICLYTRTGEPVTYHAIGRFMEEDRPVIGFRFFQEEAVHPLEFTKLAERCADELMAHYSGPYHLCGTCFGGVLAYEVARQLKERNQEVGMLAMFDALRRGRPPENELKQFQGLVKRNLKEIRMKGLKILAGRVRKKIRSSYNVIRNKRQYNAYMEACRGERSFASRSWLNEVALQYAIDRYEAEAYPGAALYFTTLLNRQRGAVHQKFWSERISDMKTYPLDCFHSEINGEEPSRYLTDIMVRYMDAYEAGKPFEPGVEEFCSRQTE